MAVCPESVLLVDDDPTTLELLVTLFETLGTQRICQAEGYEEAFQQLKQNSFSLIVTDQHLQGKSGVEILEALRSENDMTPVLLLSGTPDLDSVLRDCRQKNTDFITKPFGISDLRNAMDKLLAK